MAQLSPENSASAAPGMSPETAFAAWPSRIDADLQYDHLVFHFNWLTTYMLYSGHIQQNKLNFKRANEICCRRCYSFFKINYVELESFNYKLQLQLQDCMMVRW